MVANKKYNANKTEYMGRTFDSNLEARIASVLDQLKHPDDLLDNGSMHSYAKVILVDYQVPFTLINKSKWGRDIKYVADFLVLWETTGNSPSHTTIIEAKGYPTPVWGIKKRLFHERYSSTELFIVSKPNEVLDISEALYERYNGAAIRSDT